MLTLKCPAKQVYSEEEASQALGISVSSVRSLLDRYVFNDGLPRPESVQLVFSDLLLLSYWNEQPCERENKVVLISR